MQSRTKKTIGTLLAAGALTVGAGALTTTTAPAASAAVTCGIKDSNGVVHCSDGSYQYVDGRGHLIWKDRYGRVIRDLPPNTPWY